MYKWVGMVFLGFVAGFHLPSSLPLIPRGIQRFLLGKRHPVLNGNVTAVHIDVEQVELFPLVFSELCQRHVRCPQHQLYLFLNHVLYHICTCLEYHSPRGNSTGSQCPGNCRRVIDKQFHDDLSVGPDLLSSTSSSTGPPLAMYSDLAT